MEAAANEKEEVVSFLTPLDLEFLESSQLGYLCWDRRSPSVKKMQKGQYVVHAVVKPHV